MIAGAVSAVGGLVLIALGVWLVRRRRTAKNNDDPQPPAPAASGGDAAGVVVPIHTSTERTTLSSQQRGRGILEGVFADEHPKGDSLTVTSSTTSTSTVERAELDQSHQAKRMTIAAPVGDSGRSRGLSASGRRESRNGMRLGEALVDAASDLAGHCSIPGVGEVAKAVSILVQLMMDSRNIRSDAALRQCRSILMVLEQAKMVAEKVSSRHRWRRHQVPSLALGW